MAKTKIKRNFIQRLPRRYTIAGLVGILLILGLIYMVFIHNSSPASTTGTTADGQKVNLSPATSSDKQSNDEHKSAIVQKDQQLGDGSSNSAQPNQATVIITSADANGVKSYVSGVFEDGGSCTATASNGSQTASGSSTGFQNVSYTQCPPISWNSPLSAGKWTVTVNYKSATTQASHTTTIAL
jgi:hypothetical protein